MSSTTFPPRSTWGTLGTDVGPGTGNHKITLYRAAGGAVFGAGRAVVVGPGGAHNKPTTPYPAISGRR